MGPLLLPILSLGLAMASDSDPDPDQVLRSQLPELIETGREILAGVSRVNRDDTLARLEGFLHEINELPKPTQIIIESLLQGAVNKTRGAISSWRRREVGAKTFFKGAVDNLEEVLEGLSQPMKPSDLNDPEPRFCPFCGSSKARITIDVATWPAHSEEDPDNKAKLTEHQCDACGGRSFWT
jgi:hypothetical protein